MIEDLSSYFIGFVTLPALALLLGGIVFAWHSIEEIYFGTKLRRELISLYQDHESLQTEYEKLRSYLYYEDDAEEYEDGEDDEFAYSDEDSQLLE